MVFGEVFYALFLILSIAIYWFVGRNQRTIVIAISGVLFYGYYAGSWLFWLGLLTVGSWFVLFGLDSFIPQRLNEERPQIKKILCLILIPIFVLFLGYFKYGSFISSIFTTSDLRSVAGPLAISFFTFEFIQIAAEKFKGNIERIGFTEYVAFIFFFPTMIAGPIKKYEKFDKQLIEAKIDSRDILEGLFRIILGLVKKIFLADNLNTLIQEVGSPEKTQNIILLSGAIFLYGLRIYLDFSGYSDIAIGSSRLFGFRVPENFNLPYIRTNIAEFWRHWHISLYVWLVDYIYIPLGGSRVNFVRRLLNITITMLISGIWHGAAWNFIYWGLWHGSLLATHRVYVDKVKPQINPIITKSKPYIAFSYLLTMASVWFGWGLFMWSFNDFVHYWQLVLGG